MKRYLLRIAGLIALLLTVSTSAVAAEVSPTPPPIPTEGDVWDGTVQQPTTLVYIDETPYYEISTCEELAFIAQNSEWGRYNYILTNNLILNEVVLTWDEEGNCTNTEELLEWTPIEGLSGIFNGANHTISGLYINLPNTNKIGLFASITGQIHNLTISNSYIHGNNYVGAFLGQGDSSKIIINSCVFSGFCKASSNYVGALSGATYAANVTSCVNYGHITGQNYVGGLVGNGYIDSSVNFGQITGENYVGGISGCGNASQCINYSPITGNTYIGGLVGETLAYSSTNLSTNYGSVTGNGYIGGISASGWVHSSNNWGTITGKNNVGGIVGSGDVDESFNAGNISGDNISGGIVGTSKKIESIQIGKYSDGIITNCYNTGSVTGFSSAGGIVGYGNKITTCYSIGKISGQALAGAILCWDDPIWTPVEATDCYYLSGAGLSGCGGLTVDPDGVTAATSEQLQTQSTFANWDFNKFWSISPDKNGGYPYLQWQEDTISDIPLTGVTLSAKSKTMAVGDVIYLTANHSPTTAAAPEYSWSSSDSTVATVAQNGRIEAVAPGTTIITLSADSFSATCSIIVSARIPTEYRLNSLTVRSLSGDILSKIPNTDFWASISLTKLVEPGNVTVLLAAYDADGRYIGMFCASAEDLTKNQSITLNFYVDNSTKSISRLKVFTVSSLTNLTPLCPALEFSA